MTTSPHHAARSFQGVPFRTVLDTNILVGYALLGAEVPRRSLAIQHSVEAVRARGSAFGSRAPRAGLREELMGPDFERSRPAWARAALPAALAPEATRGTPPTGG
ncbi:PIN domain nuclease, partial [Azospirillum brasilense]|nr:PIN domain nuclease [Azospirillum brasilense]